jgi:DNA-binding FadR family transcriptional regulator
VTARTSDNFKQALPDHQKVFDAIRLQEPQNALHRMAGMLSDTRSLIRATIQPDT